MPRSEYVLSGYRGMWLMAMFDLPVTTREARKRYTRFRTLLLDEGFTMLQFSVYARYCASEEAAVPFRHHIQQQLPNDGHVRLLLVTDHQFGKMEVYYGKTSQSPESKPDQLLLF